MSSFRAEISFDANKKVENVQLKNAFSDVKKDEEIAYLVRLITPQHMRTSLFSNTMSSQIKKKEKQEELKRRELSKHQ